MNKWIGVIRLTKDAEVRYTAEQKAVARFSGACDRRFKQEGAEQTADFINCILLIVLSNLLCVCIFVSTF